MRVSFFGQYLVARGVITQAQLQEALEYQASTNRRIGELAVEQGYLSEEQVAEILAEQVTRDLNFGVIALEKGLLQRSVLYDLLFSQNIKSVYIGEAIVHKGFADMETVGRELAGFTKHFKERERDLSFLLDGFPESVFVRILLQSLQKSFLRFACCSVKILYAGDMKDISDEYKDHIVIEIREEEMSIAIVLAVSYSGFVTPHEGGLPDTQAGGKVGEDLLQAINIAVHYIKDALKSYAMKLVEDFEPDTSVARALKSAAGVIQVTVSAPFGCVGFRIVSLQK